LAINIVKPEASMSEGGLSAGQFGKTLARRMVPYAFFNDMTPEQLERLVEAHMIEVRQLLECAGALEEEADETVRCVRLAFEEEAILLSAAMSEERGHA
jgi:uncharacterized protein Yka (UPF0111/DUF47 family)